MHSFTVNYQKRDGGSRPRGQLVNVGFFLHGVPRLMLLCRLFGHRPVVDGTEPLSDLPGASPGCRWVCCDRCGVRGEPQGHLDPAVYAIGDRYHGPWATQPVNGLNRRSTQADRERGYTPPGPIEQRPRGVVGGQLILGPNALGGTVGFEVKVGNAGSEHTLAASLHAGWLGALYLHTEQHGTGLQRRLNPVGYESRLTGIRFDHGRLTWRLWSKRDSIGRHDGEPWWQHHTLDLRLRDRLLGPRRYSYTDMPGGQVARIVRMPEGDYLVRLQLQRCTLGRRRGRRTTSWSVDWTALGRGIPTKGPDRGRIYGSGVDVTDRAVHTGTWPAEAAAAVAAQITQDRTRYGWEPVGAVPIEAAA